MGLGRSVSTSWIYHYSAFSLGIIYWSIRYSKNIRIFLCDVFLYEMYVFSSIRGRRGRTWQKHSSAVGIQHYKSASFTSPPCFNHEGLPRRCSGKESACQCRRPKKCGFDSWVRKIPWTRKWQPTPAFLPGKFHGQRSLAGYSSWGRKELNNDWANTQQHTLLTMMLSRRAAALCS